MTRVAGPIGAQQEVTRRKINVAKTRAWQRSEGKNPRVSLNAKVRAYARRQGMNLEPPVKSRDNLAEQDSFSVWMLSKAQSLRAKASQPE